jgi:hypothetical protein
VLVQPRPAGLLSGSISKLGRSRSSRSLQVTLNTRTFWSAATLEPIDNWFYATSTSVIPSSPRSQTLHPAMRQHVD